MKVSICVACTFVDDNVLSCGKNCYLKALRYQRLDCICISRYVLLMTLAFLISGKALEKHGTELAIGGKLDPIIGRDDEIWRWIHILCTRTKGNHVIVGLGKTSAAEG